MPPEGKVGISPVCVLGVNINAGQEISLRLRTDDLKVLSAASRLLSVCALLALHCVQIPSCVPPRLCCSPAV